MIAENKIPVASRLGPAPTQAGQSRHDHIDCICQSLHLCSQPKYPSRILYAVCSSLTHQSSRPRPGIAQFHSEWLAQGHMKFDEKCQSVGGLGHLYLACVACRLGDAPTDYRGIDSISTLKDFTHIASALQRFAVTKLTCTQIGEMRKAAR